MYLMLAFPLLNWMHIDYSGYRSMQLWEILDIFGQRSLKINKKLKI